MKYLSQLIELPIKVDVSGLTHQEREQLQEKLFEYNIKWACGDTKLRDMLNFISVSDKMYLSHTEDENIFYSGIARGKEIKIEKLQEILGMKPKQFTKADLKDGMVVRTRTQSYAHTYLVLFSRLVAAKSHLELADYNDDLTDRDDKMWDIMEVLEFSAPVRSLEMENWELRTVWKREEKSAAQIEIEQIQKQVDELNARLETLKASV